MANNLGSLTGSMGSVCRPGRAVRAVSGIVVWRLLIDGLLVPKRSEWRPEALGARQEGCKSVGWSILGRSNGAVHARLR